MILHSHIKVRKNFTKSLLFKASITNSFFLSPELYLALNMESSILKSNPSTLAPMVCL